MSEPHSWEPHQPGYYPYYASGQQAHGRTDTPVSPTLSDPQYSRALGSGPSDYSPGASSNPRRYAPDPGLFPPPLPIPPIAPDSNGFGSSLVSLGPGPNNVALPSFSHTFQQVHHQPPPLQYYTPHSTVNGMQQPSPLHPGPPHTAHGYPDHSPPASSYGGFPSQAATPIMAAPPLLPAPAPHRPSSQYYYEAPPRMLAQTGRMSSAPTYSGSLAGHAYSTSPSSYHPSSSSLHQPAHAATYPAFSSSSAPSAPIPRPPPIITGVPYQVKKERSSLSDNTAYGGGGGARRADISPTESMQSWSGELDIDDRGEGGSQPWGMPQEEYLALAPKDKKQVRNRVGAKRFRARRKDYVATLEASVRQQGEELSTLRQQVRSQRMEIDDYRQQLGLPLESPSVASVMQQEKNERGLGLMVMQDEQEGQDGGFRPEEQNGS